MGAYMKYSEIHHIAGDIHFKPDKLALTTRTMLALTNYLLQNGLVAKSVAFSGDVDAVSGVCQHVVGLVGQPH